MALLEYINRTVPDVMKKYEPMFFSNDALFSDIERKNKVVRSGGTEVRLTRVISGHSDIYAIDGSNHSVPAVKKQTFGQMTGNWGWYSKPVTLSHYDRDRLQTPDEKKRFVAETVQAVIMDFRNKVQKQVYLGNQTDLLNIGTLNGAASGLTASGFTRGALEFRTPTAQAVSGTSYLNVVRTEDTTNDVDNWYNHFGDAAPGTDALSVLSKLKRKADSYADEGEAACIILGFDTSEKLEEEILNAGSLTAGHGAGQIMYTPADIAKGVHPPIQVIRGMRIYTNRFMDSLATEASVVDPIYGLNTSKIEWWVNAGKHFKFSGMRDLAAIGQKVDYGTVDLEAQFMVRNLLTQFCAENV